METPRPEGLDSLTKWLAVLGAFGFIFQPAQGITHLTGTYYDIGWPVLSGEVKVGFVHPEIPGIYLHPHFLNLHALINPALWCAVLWTLNRLWPWLVRKRVLSLMGVRVAVVLFYTLSVVNFYPGASVMFQDWGACLYGNHFNIGWPADWFQDN
jgi:hypothetical protein